MENFVQIHDKGYVRLVDKLGSDLTIVNAARVSHNKESKEFSEKDRRLLKYLIDHEHTSPMRHPILQFEIYAPLMVARQWWKYIVGSSHQEGVGDSLNAWNESSRRYVTEDIEFYIPTNDEWRGAPDNMKQGSAAPVGDVVGGEARERLISLINTSMEHYNWATDNNIATEQARLFLPSYGLYVRWYWTASLQSVMHFISQRLDSHAQVEIQQYAKAVVSLAEKEFPITFGLVRQS